MWFFMKVPPFLENVFGSLKKFIKAKLVILNLTADFISNFILKFWIEVPKKLFQIMPGAFRAD